MRVSYHPRVCTHSRSDVQKFIRPSASQFRLFRETLRTGAEDLSPVWADMPLGRRLQTTVPDTTELIQYPENFTNIQTIDASVAEVRCE